MRRFPEGEDLAAAAGRRWLQGRAWQETRTRAWLPRPREQPRVSPGDVPQSHADESSKEGEEEKTVKHGVWEGQGRAEHAQPLASRVCPTGLLVSNPPLAAPSGTQRSLLRRRDYTVQQVRYRPVVRAIDRLLGLVMRTGFLRLDRDEILAAARRNTRLTDWGDEAFVPRLERLIDTANEQDLTAIGRLSARGAFIKAVENRLRMEAYLKAHPEVEAVSIERPLFILGFPRTGTTLLKNLLGVTAGQRSLEMWELTNPVPRHADPERDQRIRKTEIDRLLKLAYFLAPEQEHIHAIKVDTNEECWPLFFNDFAVLNYDLTGHFSAFGDYLLTTDLAPAYRGYRRYLQLLAHQQPTDRFLLKCPEHLWFLDALTAVFPDACIVWTHRDPVASTASYSSLASLNYRMLYGEIHHHRIGAHTVDRFAQGVSRAMQARDRLGEDRFFDVNFKDLIADPVAMVHRIRDCFGMPNPPSSDAAMEAFLAAKRSDARGRHVYSPEQWGLDPGAVRRRFTDYIERFSIDLEDT